jgi:hypothetical protein
MFLGSHSRSLANLSLILPLILQAHIPHAQQQRGQSFTLSPLLTLVVEPLLISATFR